MDYRDRAGVFSDLAAYAIGFVGLSADNRADRITVSYVTGNFFSMLGRGAGARPPDSAVGGATFGADPVVVLGRSYWKKRFNGDPTVVGRTVARQRPAVHGRRRRPRGFYGVYALVEFDAYMPFGMIFPEQDYQETVERRDNHELHVIGRLKPGVSLRAGAGGGRRAGAPARAAVPRHEQDGARAR